METDEIVTELGLEFDVANVTHNPSDDKEKKAC